MTLTPQNKLQITTAIDNNPNADHNELVSILSKDISGIKFNNIIKVKSAYLKDKFAYTNKQAMLISKQVKNDLNVNFKVQKLVKVAPKQGENDRYKNADGKNKRIFRSKKIERILVSGIEKPMLSLSHSTCKTEIALHKENKDIEFILIECDKDVLRDLNVTIDNEALPVLTIHRTKVDKVIYNYGFESLGAIDLDYCNAFTNNYKEVEYVLDTKLVPINGIVSFTFSYRGGYGHGIDSLPEHIRKHANNPYLKECGVSKSDAMINGYLKTFENYEILDVKKYQDPNEVSNMGQNMVGINLKRIK